MMSNIDNLKINQETISILLMLWFLKRWVARKISIEYVEGSLFDIKSIDDKLPIEEYPFKVVYNHSGKVSLIGYVY